ncbi:prepilin-type N-terminal cleavage/methylation domain-containing protein [Kerstersia similis]|uniref:prepilin-type N-terminal cleavage/methylation domain-containing protein n=1 Tax=Kerstersia similis TaxID=206505 RepID=UPI0039EEB64B
MYSRQRGFTLIEVLVALMLIALVSLISWRALDSVERTSERLEQVSDDILALMRVFGQLDRDLRLHADNAILPEFLPAGQTAKVQALPAGIQYVKTDGGVPYLQIVRAAPADNGTWQQVRWWLEGNKLMRAIAPAGKQLPLPEPPQTGTVVLEGINLFEVRAWLPGRGWTALPAPDGSPQATGMEITLDRAAGTDAGRYRKVVLLP